MVGSTLNKKLLRDLWLWAGQIVAIAAIAACGVMAFVTMQTNYEAMYAAQSSYYAAYRFANVFASVVRGPVSVRDQIAALTSVEHVQTRVVEEVLADIPRRSEPSTLRLIGIPDGREPELNQIYVRRGRLPEAASGDEVILSEAFAQANAIDVGETIGVILNGRRHALHVVGVGLSPEYVYEMRGGVDIFPDSRHFGVAWMNNTALAGAFDMTDAFNDVSVGLSPGANEDAVIERLDRVLTPYGALGAYGRADQLSDRFVSNELRQLRAQAIAIPLIFLGIASFLVNASLSRLVATQRVQIAILKAFGYSNLAIGLHYVEAAAVTVAFGAVVGILSGWWLGYQLALLYVKFFRFPHVVFHLSLGVVGLALAISMLSGILGAAIAVRAAISLPPAEAMRPAAPLVFRPTTSSA